jgi:hypothetical protein
MMDDKYLKDPLGEDEKDKKKRQKEEERRKKVIKPPNFNIKWGCTVDDIIMCVTDRLQVN